MVERHAGEVGRLLETKHSASNSSQRPWGTKSKNSNISHRLSKQPSKVSDFCDAKAPRNLSPWSHKQFPRSALPL